MMKFRFLLALLFMMGVGWSHGKSVVPFTDSDRTEYIDLHLNTHFFLAGESLLFKVYCYDHAGVLSRLSSVAYVELIGEDQRPLAQLKIKLEKGIGSGDYFFGGNVPTGNYTLIAYTKWMRNFDDSTFFRSTLTVINPEIKTSTKNTASPSYSNVNTYSRSIQNTGVSILLEAGSYAVRQKVTLQISADTTQALSLSVNARLLEEELTGLHPIAASGVRKAPVADGHRFLPDLRGELITGVITHKVTGKPLAGSLVSLSCPSKHFDYLVSTTDSAGRYYFNAREVRSDVYFLTLLHRNNDDFSIAQEANFLEDYSAFVPSRLVVDTSMRALIERRYLPLQVENAFYTEKKDSVSGTGTQKRFFDIPDRVYNLDDFMRFPTMEDVFREIIPEIVVKGRDGQFSLSMTSLVTGERFSNQPLMLIDGIPISDPNDFMKYDPLRVKTISIVARHYFYGGLEVDGIISVETYDGDGKNVNVDKMFRLSNTPAVPTKIYYQPAYDGDQDLSRIPDFRTQLHWSPAVSIASGKSATITFYTGDLSGKYFIEVVGINSAGRKIYWKEIFEVK